MDLKGHSQACKHSCDADIILLYSKNVSFLILKGQKRNIFQSMKSRFIMVGIFNSIKIVLKCVLHEELGKELKLLNFD